MTSTAYSQYETPEHAYVAMALIAYGEWERSEDESAGYETGEDTLMLLAKVADHVAGGLIAQGNPATTWHRIAECARNLAVRYRMLGEDVGLTRELRQLFASL